MAETRVCQNCGAENERSCRYCNQCGVELDSAENGKVPGTLEPAESPEIPEAPTEDLMWRIADASGLAYDKAKAGWKIDVPLADDRAQNVFVIFNGHDDEGRDVISLLSVCGTADEAYALDLLRLNARQTSGAFALKTMQGTETFVVTRNMIAELVNNDECQKHILDIAARADEIETQLSGGKDVF